jgi:hypothetical protein
MNVDVPAVPAAELDREEAAADAGLPRFCAAEAGKRGENSVGGRGQVLTCDAPPRQRHQGGLRLELSRREPAEPGRELRSPCRRAPWTQPVAAGCQHLERAPSREVEQGRLPARAGVPGRRAGAAGSEPVGDLDEPHEARGGRQSGVLRLWGWRSEVRGCFRRVGQNAVRERARRRVCGPLRAWGCGGSRLHGSLLSPTCGRRSCAAGWRFGTLPATTRWSFAGSPRTSLRTSQAAPAP